MSIIVGSNSYVSENELIEYAADRGIDLTGGVSTVLIKAMDYLETRNWVGTKTAFDQPLQFPRVLCSYGTLCEFDSVTVPYPIKNAQMMAAILIASGYDLQPVVGRVTKREKVDVIEVEYDDKAPLTSQFTGLQDILRPFIQSGVRGQRV